jgi:aminopeptidase N
VIRLSSLGYPGTDELQTNEISRDPSDSGAEALLTAQAAWPDISVKDKYLGQVYDTTDSATSAELKAMILKMFPSGQESLLREAADGILESLLRLDAERDQDFIEDYVRDLLPALCSSESVARLAGSIDDRGSLGLIATKALRVAHQEDQRCLAMAAKQLE